MNSRQEKALKDLENEYVTNQLTEFLYEQRQLYSSNSLILDNSMLDFFVYFAETLYDFATAPSRQEIKEKIEKGLLDDALIRQQLVIQFKNFIADLNEEEKIRVIESQCTINQTIDYYVSRKLHLKVSNQLINRYREEEKTAVGKDKQVIQNNIFVLQEIHNATYELPKILPSQSQLQKFNETVSMHQKMLEKNNPMDSKLFTALALTSALFPFIGGLFVAVTVVATIIKPKEVEQLIEKSRFIADLQASTLPSEAAKLAKHAFKKNP